MKYVVYLVQRGISNQTHPVSGKSGKQYGSAVYSAKDKGVVFKMSLEDYTKDQHDIVGNPAPNQQWVPDFVPEAEAAAAGGQEIKPKCCIPAGCHEGPGGAKADATHIWDRDVYCAAHAPNNAKPLYADSPALAVVPPPPEVSAPVVEAPPVLVEGPSELPREDMPPPMVDGADVRAESVSAPLVEAQPVPPARPQTQPPPPASAPAPQSQPEQPSAVEVIAAAVTAAMGPVEERLLAHIDAKLAGKPQKKPTKRVALGGKTNLAPTAFQVLQQKAKGMGINVYGMGTEKLKAAIAEKEAAPPA